MSVMSQLKRKQSNLMFPKKRTKLTNEEFAVRLLCHVKKHLLAFDEHEIDFADQLAEEIINYLVHCIKIKIEPSRDYILSTMQLEIRALEAFK